MGEQDEKGQARGERLARIRERMEKARPFVIVAAVPVAFCLVELPLNGSLLTMGPLYVLLNLIVIGVLFAIVYLIGQRSRAAVVVFLAICLVFGMVNHFLVEFKGWPLMPADLFALSTAASVGAGYTLSLNASLAISIVLFAAYCVLLWLTPKVKINVRRFATSTVAAIVVAVCFGWWMNAVDLEEAYGCTVDVWSVKESYAEHGSTLCFLKRIQDMTPVVPDGYSPDTAEELLTEGAVAPLAHESTAADQVQANVGEDAIRGSSGEGDAVSVDDTSGAAAPATLESADLDVDDGMDSSAGGAGAADSQSTQNASSEVAVLDSSDVESEEEMPTVIAIMNETFSDLSIYSGLEGSDAYPSAFHEIADDALESGTAYVSAFGGGTCNSEFEFLTGSSMSLLGGGVYPYMMYDLSGVDSSLASYFSSLGYSTHAIHPAGAANWRRQTVYPQLGFDDFSDISVFEDAETLRNLVTDRETYDYILDLLDKDEDPQFIFDVTIQNHGGYDKGGIDDEDLASIALPDGSTSAELDEYVSCIQRSDKDLAYLVDQLNALDRPIYLCFFGDHQPNLSEWLYEATEGVSVSDGGLEAAQDTYSVPYFIWANDAARAAAGVDAANGADSVAQTSSEEASDIPAELAAATESSVASDGSISTSLNYLGARLVGYTGLDLSQYQKFLLNTSTIVPAVNINGFLLPDGTWHSTDEEDGDDSAGDANEVLRDYAIVQYGDLFG